MSLARKKGVKPEGHQCLEFSLACVDIHAQCVMVGRSENLSVLQSQCQNSSGELGDVGDGGRLRCLHGKVDTTISVCVHVVLARPVFWVRGLWPWCYGCHLSVII